MNASITTIVLDIDGTLSNEVSWLKLTEFLGASIESHKKIFDDYKNSITDYPTAKSKLIKLWHDTGNANRSKMLKIFRSWVLRSDAKEIVEYLRAKGYRLCIMSGSVDLYVQSVAEKLGIPDYYANTELVFDEEGGLIDFHYFINQAETKFQHFSEFAQNNRLSTKECAIIGNGDSDVILFRELGYGVAVDHDIHEEVKEYADEVISELSEIKKIFGEINL